MQISRIKLQFGHDFCFIFVLYYKKVMQLLKKITFGAAILFFLGSFAPFKITNTEEIKWYDWNEGVAKARAEGKIALIDTYTLIGAIGVRLWIKTLILMPRSSP
jgi:hypothetical protein